LALRGKGRAALASALGREDWAVQRDGRLFHLASAFLASAPGITRSAVGAKREFLQAELAREQMTLRSVRREVGHRYHEAVGMLGAGDRAIPHGIAVDWQGVERVAASRSGSPAGLRFLKRFQG